MAGTAQESVTQTRPKTCAPALAAWLTLAGIYYLTLPIYGVLSVFAWLLLGASWLWAIIASLDLAMSLFIYRSWREAAGTLLIAVAAGIGIWNTDWLSIYLKSQLWLHQSELSHMSAQHRDGALPAHTRLPWQMRYLSIDGKAHRQPHTGTLFIPMWQNWRGEAGGGIVYLTTEPNQDTWIPTAPGGQGRPERYIADGWWWVEGG